MGFEADIEGVRKDSTQIGERTVFQNDAKAERDGNGFLTAQELEVYGETKRGLSPRHVQLMAIGGTQYPQY